MAESKRYYWLKLQHDFFGSKRIKKLRTMENGDTCVVIYLKMQLKSIKSNGVLEFYGLEPTFEEELALDLDEDVECVKQTVKFLMDFGMLVASDDTEYFMPFVQDNTGSETADAARMRESRDRRRAYREPKTDAERQESYRAKQYVAGKALPLIEDYVNKTRYNGNYYIVLKRDDCKCAICGSEDNICVHHIDEFDADIPETSDKERLVTLCRSCHGKVQKSSEKIPEEVLSRIGYTALRHEQSSLHNESAAEITKPSTEQEPAKEKPKKETALQIYERLTESEFTLPTDLNEKMKDWMKYKIERKESYKETGLRSLLKQTIKYREQYGEKAVCDLIDKCMSSNWAGIIWERLEKGNFRTKQDRLQNRVSEVDNW